MCTQLLAGNGRRVVCYLYQNDNKYNISLSFAGPDDDYTVHIDSIVVSPDPPQPGQNLTVTVKGVVKAAIEV